jgi:aryl-alcohol dehydrogenase-like predicted oxidoreductase
MEYRRLGNSGLKVSRAGLGCNNFGWRCDEEQSAAVVHKALDLGVNFFDTSNSYGRGLSEEYLGRALAGRRSEAVIATKVGSRVGEGPLESGASRRHIMQQVEGSLRRLATDYIDLYQIHFPDESTPTEETMRALDDLVRQGKARYVGCSNYAAWQVVESQWVAKTHDLTPFVSAQNRYSLMERRIERELVAVCGKYGLGVLPYFPLASGFLTGKYRRGEPLPEGTRLAAVAPMAGDVLTEHNFDVLERLEAFAQARGRSMVDLALGWLANHSYISSVIAGATRPEQVEQNVSAVSWRLTAEETAEIDAMT